MDISDFDFDLPQALITQHPPKVRGDSRLLAALPDMSLQDTAFSDLPDYIGTDDALVSNNIKVIEARLSGQGESGGKIEALIERVLDGHTTLTHIRSSESLKAGTVLISEGGIRAVTTECTGDLFCPRFDCGQTVYEPLEQNGRLPLPPYIERAADDGDDSRCQTAYTKYRGTVATPTVGLYFIDELLGRLKAKGMETVEVTLHIGAGTFQPVHVSNTANHKVCSEWFDVSPETAAATEVVQARGGRVQMIGTTSMRTLESTAREIGRLEAGQDDTDIFIMPSCRFDMVDHLITNFHLPKLTLLMLAAMFSDMEHIHAVYRHVVEHEYHFFSYDDAMLLERAGRQAYFTRSDCK